MIWIKRVLQSEHEAQTEHAEEHSIHFFLLRVPVNQFQSKASKAAQKSATEAIQSPSGRCRRETCRARRSSHMSNRQSSRPIGKQKFSLRRRTSKSCRAPVD